MGLDTIRCSSCLNNLAWESGWRVAENPKLHRVIDPKANLAEIPVTEAERVVVVFLVAHINTCLKFSKSGMLIPVEQLKKDVRELFSLPIPMAVWKELRNYQDRDGYLSRMSFRERGEYEFTPLVFSSVSMREKSKLVLTTSMIESFSCIPVPGRQTKKAFFGSEPFLRFQGVQE